MDNSWSSEPWSSLGKQLVSYGSELRGVHDWPRRSLDACSHANVHRWFLPTDVGGLGWSERQITEGYLWLARHCLTTAFILTQRTGAMKRIAASSNEVARQRWIPGLLDGSCFGTVGISHLTTSRQFVGKPVLQANPVSPRSWRLNGYSPWVTGACHAQVLVVGATCPDGTQILAAVPTELSGVKCYPGEELLALSASCTGRVEFCDVEIESEHVLFGPVDNVMASGSGGSTGGLQTSTLAVGLTHCALDYLLSERERRTELQPVVDKLANDLQDLTSDLLSVAGGADHCSASDLRGRANSLVLRATQAALTVAKGTGFSANHPVGRWATEALFFLVWSCPQPVLQTNLCELAGLS